MKFFTISLFAMSVAATAIPELFERDVSCAPPCDNGSYDGKINCPPSCGLKDKQPCFYRMCKNSHDVRLSSHPQIEDKTVLKASLANLRPPEGRLLPPHILSGSRLSWYNLCPLLEQCTIDLFKDRKLRPLQFPSSSRQRSRLGRTHWG